MTETATRKRSARRTPAKKNATASASPRKRTTAAAATNGSAQARLDGRVQAQAVRSYLDALEQVNGNKRRGRRRTPESIQNRLDDIAAKLTEADSLTRLRLTQQQMDLSNELEQLTNSKPVDLTGPQKAFVASARPYAQRHGIGYGAFRSLGVPAEVLREAGITRGM